MRTPIIYDEDGGERELPFCWHICPDCSGHGKSSAYLGAFTADQMCEDPEFAEDYMSGFYDRYCRECDGTGKIKVVDYKAMPKADRDAYRRQEEERIQADEIERQERLFEGGWREEGWFG